MAQLLIIITQLEAYIYDIYFLKVQTRSYSVWRFIMGDADASVLLQINLCNFKS